MSAVPCASIEAPPKRCSSVVTSGDELLQDLDGGRRDLRADPVSGQDDDVGHSGEPSVATMFRRT